MKKFKEAHKVSFKNDKGSLQSTLLTYADILVSVSDQNDRKELYTGFVVDYDLKGDDISQLDKIYLIDTHRYKKKEKFFDENRKEIIEENTRDTPIKSRNRLRVPGDIFILKAKNIVNLNLTYIPSKKKKKVYEEKKQRGYLKIQKWYLIVTFLIILIHFFYGVLKLDETFLKDYFTNTGFWGKVLIILFLNQFISIFVPLENKKGKLSYNFKNSIFYLKILALFLITILSYLVVIKNLIR
ncbi:hypothetical protein V2595_13600 [Tenacibaculum maritimum]|uniref:hypothetical protein n=7 Tax=Tenacibaculum maritimum TaxID=107401 RepID=UPI0012E473BA|nr:hypothetical protein [Tenacibaculum maritimum]CAA0237652.1 conserved membrane hypothetical protein [Tenacibaculum maritimum]